MSQICFTFIALCHKLRVYLERVAAASALNARVARVVLGVVVLLGQEQIAGVRALGTFQQILQNTKNTVDCRTSCI